MLPTARPVIQGWRFATTRKTLTIEMTYRFS